MKRLLLLVTLLAMSVAILGALQISGPRRVHPDEQMSVAVVGRQGTDAWVGLYRQGSADGEYLAYQYVRQLAGGVFSARAPREYGTYEFRLFKDSGYNRIETSETVQVVPFQLTFHIDPPEMTPGTTVAVEVSGVSNTEDQWIGLFRVDQPDTAYLAWAYLRTLPSNRYTVTLPREPGPYEFRVFLDQEYFVIGKSSDAPRTGTGPRKAEDSVTTPANSDISGIWTRSANINNKGTVQELPDVALQFVKNATNGYDMEMLDANAVHTSWFTVEVSEKNGKMRLQIHQRASNGYTSDIDVVMEDANRFVGTWHDVRGNRGDYYLQRNQPVSSAQAAPAASTTSIAPVAPAPQAAGTVQQHQQQSADKGPSTVAAASGDSSSPNIEDLLYYDWLYEPNEAIGRGAGREGFRYFQFLEAGEVWSYVVAANGTGLLAEPQSYGTWRTDGALLVTSTQWEGEITWKYLDESTWVRQMPPNNPSPFVANLFRLEDDGGR